MPPLQLSASLAACALAMELHGPGSAAAAAEMDRCCRLRSRLPREQQSLNPQGLEALCRMLAVDAERGLSLVRLFVGRMCAWPPAAAQMAAEERLIRWAYVVQDGARTRVHVRLHADCASGGATLLHVLGWACSRTPKVLQTRSPPIKPLFRPPQVADRCSSGSNPGACRADERRRDAGGICCSCCQ